MAQSGYTPILIYASGTTGNTPSASNLTSSSSGSELALNYYDGKLFYKDNTGTVQVIASKASNIGNFSSDITVHGLTVGLGTNSISYNTALGNGVLAGSNSGTGRNTAIGSASLASNTTGAYNTAIGNYDSGGGAALQSNTSGSYNTAVGNGSLNSNTTATNNTALGYQAGYTNTTGGYNTFIGAQAGYTSNYNGNAFNTCVGYQVGYSLTTGIGNTFIGGANSPSGYYVTTGSNNTILGGYNGNQGGLDIRTSSNYIVLSDGQGNIGAYWDNSRNMHLPASGSGIIFNNSSALTNSTLNDYETGTFSLAVSSSGYTLSSSSGYYTKIGNMVFVHGVFNFSAINASGNSDVNLTGLPFTSANNQDQNGIARDNSTTGAIFITRVPFNASYMEVNSYSGVTTGSTLTFATGKNYTFNMAYQANF